jgi:hypothetical protein
MTPDGDSGDQFLRRDILTAGKFCLGLDQGADGAGVGQHGDRFLERLQIPDGQQNRRWSAVHGDAFVLAMDAGDELGQVCLDFGQG